MKKYIFARPAALGLMLCAMFVESAVLLAATPDCVAVASDVNGVFVANADGTPLIGAPVIERLGMTQVALSPDRQNLAAEFFSAPGVLTFARSGVPLHTLSIPDNLTFGYPISSIRWESNTQLRVSRKGKAEREYQFLTLTAGAQGMALTDAIAPLVGADCLMLQGSGQGLCVSGSLISINDAVIPRFSGQAPRSIPPAKVLQTTQVMFGSTALLLGNPVISLALGTYDAATKEVAARIEGPDFGYTEARLRVNDELKVISAERQLRIYLSGMGANAAAFTVYEAGSPSGFLEFNHIAQAGSPTSGNLIYSMRSANGTELLGLAGVFGTNSVISWSSGVDETPIFRVRNTHSIRGIDNGNWVQVDDVDGTYVLPVGYTRVWYPPVTSGEVLSPGFYRNQFGTGIPVILPKTVKSKFNPRVSVDVKAWQCR